MRESIINLARIKETFSQSMVSEGSSQGIDAVPSLIRGIKSGLMMLNKTRAMQVVEQVGDLLMLALSGAGPGRLTQKETDRLADAIVSIEYYMETVKAGRSEPWYMLDNAEACLSVLRDLEARLKAEQDEEPAAAVSQTLRVEKPDFDAIAAAEQTAPPPEQQMTTVMPATRRRLSPKLPSTWIRNCWNSSSKRPRKKSARSTAICQPGPMRQTTWKR